jgi:predicted AlkP superfamily pyrophosphatase or phosphodiesterase
MTKCSTLFLLIVASFFVLPLTAYAAPDATTFDHDRIVVLISVDGLAGYYLDDPKAEMPTLRKLIAEGARAESMKAVSPTVTWPNHTTLVTGVYPAKHGVVGNNFYDRAAGKRFTLISDPVFDKEQIVKVPTIYDAAHAAGLKTAGIRWPATRNANSLDWQFPDVALFALMHKYTTPALKAEMTEAGLWADIDKAEQAGGKGDAGRWLPSDEMLTKAFNLILTKHRPNFAMLHLIDVDHIEHMKGPRSPEAYAAIKSNDACVAEVWETLQREFPGKATIFVVSDHGFSPIKKIVLPNVVLRKAKLLNEVDADAKKDAKPSVRVVVQGGSTMVYILDQAQRTGIAERIKTAFKGLEGVAKVLGPDETAAYGIADPKVDPNAPDMMIFAQLGYAFGDTAAGDLPFQEKPERKGTHGHDPNLPELHASFLAWGAGIKPGAKVGEISNTQVTPTIAKLMGLEMSNLDGKPLDDILGK